MKFSKLSQLFLVSSIGLIVAALLTACDLVTIDYVFVAASAGNSSDSPGQIYTYAADSHTGALRPAAPTVSSGGTGPVALAVTPDYANLYVANQGNNTIVQFSVSGSGVLTQKTSTSLGATPISLAVNSAGTYLYVVTGPTATTQGALTEYQLSSGSIVTPATATENLALLSPYSGDTIVPTGVVVLANGNAVYVSAYDQSAAYTSGKTSTSGAHPGWVFGYAVAGGALSGVAGSPYQAGVKPSALATDPTNRFVFVTDFSSSSLIGFEVESGDWLYAMNGLFKTGNDPSAITIDPRGLYIYLSNSLDSTVSAYSIALPTGIPSTVVNSTSSSANATDTDPVAIIVDPSLGRFVYTANNQGDSISGFELNPNTGAITATQAAPYPTGANPTALIAIPHGNHALETTSP